MSNSSNSLSKQSRESYGSSRRSGNTKLANTLSSRDSLQSDRSMLDLGIPKVAHYHDVEEISVLTEGQEHVAYNKQVSMTPSCADHSPSSSQDDNSMSSAVRNSLFTFRRQVDEHTSRETTIQATGDDTMQDMVKRLQQRAKQIMTFSKSDVEGIKLGEKRVVFQLNQVNGARFDKSEFGSMTTADVLMLTSERPLIVELCVEDTIANGETIEIF